MILSLPYYVYATVMAFGGLGQKTATNLRILRPYRLAFECRRAEGESRVHASAARANPAIHAQRAGPVQSALLSRLQNAAEHCDRLYFVRPTGCSQDAVFSGLACGHLPKKL